MTSIDFETVLGQSHLWDRQYRYPEIKSETAKMISDPENLYVARILAEKLNFNVFQRKTCFIEKMLWRALKGIYCVEIAYEILNFFWHNSMNNEAICLKLEQNVKLSSMSHMRLKYKPYRPVRSVQSGMSPRLAQIGQILFSS